MGLFQTQKPHSAAKIMVRAGTELNEVVLDTLGYMANLAGVTLGPGGRAVVIERQEMNMDPIHTKDGVTVIKHMGYSDPIRQVILESARSAALRTASSAGDGTTTATVLAHAITVATSHAVKANPRTSPQSIVREMERLIPHVTGLLDKYKIVVDGDNADEILLQVATLSANGDQDLAKAIMKAMDQVGDEGNLTIVEASGPSKYHVERINGYAIDTGYEQTAKQHANGFINDRSGTMVSIPKPIVLLFDGVISDMSQIFQPMVKLNNYLEANNIKDGNIVLVAHGFSDTFIGDLHVNWVDSRSTMKIFPLLTPELAIMNWRTAFLYDLQAYTGCPVFNPVSKPLIDMDPQALVRYNRTSHFECGRFRASIMVKDEDAFAIEIRLGELKQQLERPESEYERRDLEVRIGKLTSGIARLEIHGGSPGETREKRDRADDAWCAVRGAIKHGAVPGGGYALVRLSADLAVQADKLTGTKRIAAQILSDSLLAPVRALYLNYGYKEHDVEPQIALLLKNDDQAFDITTEQWVDKHEVLDSLPAVGEAIRNSVSIASLLGTMGGIIAFRRDKAADSEEQRFTRGFERSIGENQ